MTQERLHDRPRESSATGETPPSPKIAEIATWLGQFSRTLKTCRLYDARNPNTVKFREDLVAGMGAMLENHGAFTLEFSAREVACDGHKVMTSRTREDNFAMPFYRDGLRTLTFNPGTEPRELNMVLDLVLRVTSRANRGNDDLVTLLWDADLSNIDMAYVAAETDADLGDDGEVTLGASVPHHGELMPWPGGAGPGDASAVDAAAKPGGAPDAITEPQPAALPEGEANLRPRSDDWLAGDATGDLNEAAEALMASSAAEVERFVTAMRRERALPLAQATLALARQAIGAGLRDDDREDIADLLQRALLESIATADWPGAHDAIGALLECTDGEWDPMELGDVLASPDSPVTAALMPLLDAHTVIRLQEFALFARGLGPAAIEWLMGIVATAANQRTRRTLVRTLADMCEGNPERLAPWLGDPRWYVVRNAVLVAGSTTEGAPPSLFVHLLGHEDVRVRQEVVTALAKSDTDLARPLLLKLLHDAEPAIRSAALHQLSTRRNPQAAEAVLQFVLDPGFRKRPAEEIRSVTAALGGCGGDEVLPALEAQLYPPKWFSHGDGPYCQTIARCINRIGTPAATAVLKRGAESRTAATRDACRLVLKGANNG